MSDPVQSIAKNADTKIATTKFADENNPKRNPEPLILGRQRLGTA